MLAHCLQRRPALKQHWVNASCLLVTIQLAPEVDARLANITTCHPLPCYLITVSYCAMGYNFPLMNCSLSIHLKIICIEDKFNFDVVWAYLVPSLYLGNEVRPKTNCVTVDCAGLNNIRCNRPTPLELEI